MFWTAFLGAMAGALIGQSIVVLCGLAYMRLMEDNPRRP